MSATDSSPVCPIPVQTGLVATAMARATTSESKAARSAFDPPPLTTHHQITVGAAQRGHRPATADGASPPCTATGTTWTWNPNPDPVSWPRKS